MGHTTVRRPTAGSARAHRPAATIEQVCRLDTAIALRRKDRVAQRRRPGGGGGARTARRCTTGSRAAAARGTLQLGQPAWIAEARGARRQRPAHATSPPAARARRSSRLVDRPLLPAAQPRLGRRAEPRRHRQPHVSGRPRAGRLRHRPGRGPDGAVVSAPTDGRETYDVTRLAAVGHRGRGRCSPSCSPSPTTPAPPKAGQGAVPPRVRARARRRLRRIGLDDLLATVLSAETIPRARPAPPRRRTGRRRGRGHPQPTLMRELEWLCR